MEEFERNEAARRAAEDADSLGEDSQGNQVGLPVSLMPNVNPDLMADRPEVMAAVRTQQLVSSGMYKNKSNATKKHFGSNMRPHIIWVIYIIKTHYYDIYPRYGSVTCTNCGSAGCP